MADIPLGLSNSIETHSCVLFVGAGVGCHFKANAGGSAPTGRELCQLLCDKFSITYQPNCYLSQVAELIELRKGRKELEAFISSILSGLEPDNTFKWITSVRWRAIYTTNYDNCIERAYQLCPKPLQNPVPFSITSDLRNYQPFIDVPIFHIHGYLYSGTGSNIIITKSDYAKFRQKRKMLFESLKFEMTTNSILYIGYSNEDTNWETLLEETLEDFYPSKLPQSFRVDPFADEIDMEILRSKNIHTMKCSFKEFVDSISVRTATTETTDVFLSAFKKNVPPDLVPAFNLSPVPIIRLLSSWEYVNQAAFNQASNFANFLKGDGPNWSLVEKGQFFERDVQGDLYDAVLDFATAGRTSPAVSVVLGAAGYGTSTLLRIIAVKTVKEGAGSVFMLKPGAQVLPGDIEYACALFPTVVFIVDNAADHAAELDRSVHLLRESKKSALFLLGDRLNEWHQRSSRPRGQEYQIEPLSDGEIDRLLDFLGKYNALNQLENLPREIQHSIVKERHQKELLVVMREATENNSFDAIIESEYRGIGDEYSRLFYLYICCFYQHGALVRDSLLSAVMGADIAILYEKISVTTEGVVVFETIDETRGLYAARARHHKIAAVVWERCSVSGQKEEIIQKTLGNLNLNYGIDARAFDLFVRSDRMVDCIRTLEGRISFFEQASKMDPQSPYVRQHYARMLSRSGQHGLAMAQIDNAIKIDPTVKVLYHTRGKILSELALSAENIDMGRRYVVQAESCFNKGIYLNNKNDYCYESLASLYFDWSHKIFDRDAAEAADYLSKAEETISLGLRTVRNRESLWVLSSKIQFYLGDTPKSVSALEKAVSERTGSIIARYVLARAYRQQGRPKDALVILEPVIRSSTDEFRAFVEYALSLLESGRPYKEAVAILELSTLYGFSDPRFISVYGGVLFLNGDFTKADEVFAKAMDRTFPANELYQLHYRPFDKNDNSKPFCLTGEVVAVKTGYSLLQPAGYPQIICHASKYKGALMSKGLSVTFELAFCAKGAVALYPTPVVA